MEPGSPGPGVAVTRGLHGPSPQRNGTACRTQASWVSLWRMPLAPVLELREVVGQCPGSQHSSAEEEGGTPQRLGSILGRWPSALAALALTTVVGRRKAGVAAERPSRKPLPTSCGCGSLGLGWDFSAKASAGSKEGVGGQTPQNPGSQGLTFPGALGRAGWAWEPFSPGDNDLRKWLCPTSWCSDQSRSYNVPVPGGAPHPHSSEVGSAGVLSTVRVPSSDAPECCLGHLQGGAVSLGAPKGAGCPQQAKASTGSSCQPVHVHHPTLPRDLWPPLFPGPCPAWASGSEDQVPRNWRPAGTSPPHAGQGGHGSRSALASSSLHPGLPGLPQGLPTLGRGLPICQLRLDETVPAPGSTPAPGPATGGGGGVHLEGPPRAGTVSFWPPGLPRGGLGSLASAVTMGHTGPSSDCTGWGRVEEQVGPAPGLHQD